MSAVPFIGVAALSLVALRLLFAAARAAALAAAAAPRHGGAGAAADAADHGRHLRTEAGLSDDSRIWRRARPWTFWPATTAPLHDLAYRFAARVPLPLGFSMVPMNFLGVEWHNEHGHLSFLLGRTDLDGWWYFYLVALAVKTPLPLLLLGLHRARAARGARLARRRCLPAGPGRLLRVDPGVLLRSTATSTSACATY